MKRIIVLLFVLQTPVAASEANVSFKKYKLPANGGATATIRFPKGDLHLSINRGDAQYYGVLRGRTCAATQRLMIYDAGIGGNTTEKAVPIEAGHRLRILASIQKQENAGY